MSLKNTFDQHKKRRANGLVILPDIGWVGNRPAHTRAEKIDQIKTDVIDERALVVIGGTRGDFDTFPTVSAHASVQDLVKEIEKIESREERSLLIIGDMDTASAEEQQQIVPLIKDRRILTTGLPKNVQIILPVQDAQNVLPDIQRVAFLIEV